MTDAHPFVLGLFDTAGAAAVAAHDLRALGVARERVSIVARNHDQEGRLAEASGGSPGSEIEDSRVASRLGELTAHLIAAVAIVLPGIGPIVADGPLAAGLGEAAGHLAGGIAPALERAGLAAETAAEWERRIHGGAVLTGAHVDASMALAAAEVLTRSGAVAVSQGHWRDE